MSQSLEAGIMDPAVCGVKRQRELPRKRFGEIFERESFSASPGAADNNMSGNACLVVFHQHVNDLSDLLTDQWFIGNVIEVEDRKIFYPGIEPLDFFPALFNVRFNVVVWHYESTSSTYKAYPPLFIPFGHS